MADDRRLVVGARPGDLPEEMRVPGSVLRTCESCGEELMVSPSAQGIEFDGAVCLHCWLQGYLGDTAPESLTDDQLREFMAVFFPAVQPTQELLDALREDLHGLVERILEGLACRR